MQNFLSFWLNAGAQITHGGQVQSPRQKEYDLQGFMQSIHCKNSCLLIRFNEIWEVVPCGAHDFLR